MGTTFLQNIHVLPINEWHAKKQRKKVKQTLLKRLFMQAGNLILDKRSLLLLVLGFIFDKRSMLPLIWQFILNMRSMRLLISWLILDMGSMLLLISRLIINIRSMLLLISGFILDMGSMLLLISWLIIDIRSMLLLISGFILEQVHHRLQKWPLSRLLCTPGKKTTPEIQFWFIKHGYFTKEKRLNKFAQCADSAEYHLIDPLLFVRLLHLPRVSSLSGVACSSSSASHHGKNNFRSEPAPAWLISPAFLLVAVRTQH